MGKSMTKLGLAIMYTFFNIATFIKLLNFAYNWKEISKSMRDIKTRVEAAEDMTNALENEKNFIRVVKVTCGIILSEIISESMNEIASHGDYHAYGHNLYFFNDTRYTIVYVAMRIVAVCSGLSHEVAAIVIFFTYYNTCMHIKSLYDQLHGKLSA
jgi:hypothetical protein